MMTALPAPAPAPTPAAAGLAVPPRARRDLPRTGPGLRRAAAPVRRARVLLLALTLAPACGLVLAFWHGVDRAAVPGWVLTPALALFAINALWLSAGAAFALIGLRPDPTDAPPTATHTTTRPGRTAILWLICGEPPAPIAARIKAMARDLAAAELAEDCTLFILSDTQGTAPRRAEARALAPLIARGAAHYRNRPRNTGHKPGNIADWLRRHGAGFETMLVMDADSAMSVPRLQRLRRAMAADATLGLVQSGIRLRPGQSRFAALQRLSARLCGPAFLRGFANVSGDAGNYWGHNALIRVRAFAGAAGLPTLPGRPPMGGPVLSHDIVEAAWLVRAGWGVRVLPEAAGSFEAGPDTLAAFHRRDRRWCQGNLQHLRLIGAAGLHPLSRLHLVCGVQNYLAAPIWLTLVLLFASGLLHPAPGAGLTLLAVAAVLLLPKLAALRHWQRRLGRTDARARRVLRRAVVRELVLSSLLAPLVMLRQTLAVAQVALGRHCGWRPGNAARTAARIASRTAPDGAVEMAAGAGLVALSLGLGGGGPAALILAPVAGPLLAAPWLIRWFDRAPCRHPAPLPPLTAPRALPAG